MLWQVSSGDLDVVIKSSENNLDKNIIKAIEKEIPQKLGMILHCRRLTGWPTGTTVEELEGEDLYLGVEWFLRKHGRWQA